MTTGRGHRVRRFIALTAALLLTFGGGCAVAPEFAWQQADDIIVGRADAWLDLESSQEQRLRQRLQPWLKEVRGKQLGKYADFLHEMAGRIDEDIGLDDARWANERFDTLYRETMRSFLPVITPTLAELSPAQRRHLAQRMQERNRDYREDYIDGRNEGRYALAERIIEAVERWTGTLEPKQRGLVHANVRELPRTAPAWFRYRRDMQQRLLQQIENGAAPAEIERTLHRWWIERGRHDIPQWERMEQLRRGLQRTLVELGRSLSDLQRAEARRRLRTRADNLRTIAAGAD